MNFIEHEIRKKYRYSNLSYVFDVYMECEYRANLTQEEYDGLLPGEFRFDYESWGRRLGFTKKQMERAIKELTTKSVVIIQTVKGNKGTSSKYFLTRFNSKFEENNKENNKESNRRTINLENNSFSNDTGEPKEQYKENKKEHSSQYNNLNIISNNIYSDFVKEFIKIYPGKKVKSVRDKKLPGLIQKYGIEQMKRCVQRYVDYVQAVRTTGVNGGKPFQLQFQNESTFWNSSYIDYLDENYEEIEIRKEDPTNVANDFIEELYK